ncbi:hypothetical protein [Limosilactobacillus equigenerosi]|nr:hypothetical protein [Limosilactobacillus equigenerosi]
MVKKITEHDYYEAAKTTAQGKQTFQELILNATLEKQYGKKG